MTINPSDLPEAIHYLIPLAERHGYDARIHEFNRVQGRYVDYAESLSFEEIAELRDLYNRIKAENHVEIIHKWHVENSDKRDTAWPIYGLIFLFLQLARLNYPPFNDGIITPMK